MPAYPGNDLAKLLYENQQAFLWNNEVAVVGSASIAFQLRRERGASYPFGASFELFFSGAPGVFEMDIQVADTDQDLRYITVATIAAVNANNVTRYDMTNLYPKYVRGKLVALANVVNTTLQVTR